jgi:hypothetical protein
MTWLWDPSQHAAGILTWYKLGNVWMTGDMAYKGTPRSPPFATASRAPGPANCAPQVDAGYQGSRTAVTHHDLGSLVPSSRDLHTLQSRKGADDGWYDLQGCHHVYPFSLQAWLLDPQTVLHKWTRDRQGSRKAVTLRVPWNPGSLAAAGILSRRNLDKVRMTGGTNYKNTTTITIFCSKQCQAWPPGSTSCDPQVGAGS